MYPVSVQEISTPAIKLIGNVFIDSKRSPTHSMMLTKGPLTVLKPTRITRRRTKRQRGNGYNFNSNSCLHSGRHPDSKTILEAEPGELLPGRLPEAPPVHRRLLRARFRIEEEPSSWASKLGKGSIQTVLPVSETKALIDHVVYYTPTGDRFRQMALYLTSLWSEQSLQTRTGRRLREADLNRSPKIQRKLSV